MMNKKSTYMALNLIALAPMTVFLFFSIWGLIRLVSIYKLNSRDILLTITFIFGILGYVGLVMNMIADKQKKWEIVNFILLLLGIIGFVMFACIEGGIHLWKWLINIDEPLEWLLYVAPFLITLFLTIIKGGQLIALYNPSKP